ncbi:fructosamine kinase family protein [Arcanobacterium haemolyticum]|nr:fructosamine kinase family protein [Arcanobacterium haemolyticum]
MSFRKNGTPRQIAAEVAGLLDLSDAARVGGAPVVRLLTFNGRSLETASLSHAAPTAEAAREFGRALAHTHAYAPDRPRIYGQAPQQLAALYGENGVSELVESSSSLTIGYDGVMGDERLPLVPVGGPVRSWGEFYAHDRIMPYMPRARDNGSLDREGVRVLDALLSRLVAGDFDAPEPQLVTAGASLIHGDLWSGNVLWTTTRSQDAIIGTRPSSSTGTVGVLIDPACHSGHGESDLAQLGVFGMPFLSEIYRGYNDESALAEGWKERIGLHQIHILIVHAALFGGSYGYETITRAQRYI